MSRRKKSTVDDYSYHMLTRLFAGLLVLAAVAGLVGEVTR